MADLQDFHYMSVLRQLELEAGILKGGRRESTDRKKVARLMRIFEVLRGLRKAELGQDEKIAQALKLSLDEQLKVEKAVVANLRELTEDRAPADEARQTAGEWPPVIPVSRMVERFTAIAIGLHAENPRVPFAKSLAAAFEEAVAPALAWGLMIALYELPEELRKLTQTKLVERLAQGRAPSEIEVTLGGEAYRKVRLPYLRLVEAWFRLFAPGKLCALPPEESTKQRQLLAALAATPLEELDTLLWQRLGGLYVATLAGSERARAVAKASGHAAFVRERLALFDAAMADGIQDFRLRTEHRLDDAARQTFACDEEKPADPLAAGLEGCGAAFWLARACFGRHDNPHADAASRRVLELLLRAAELLKDEPERATACLRYAAGFATNPRYARSAGVLAAQNKLIERYAASPRARRALVAQFRGRVAWQEWQAGVKKAKAVALAHYAEALRAYDQGGDGLDAEGPIHFFPELVVLLGQSADRGEREKATLAAVDFISQRNFGIYFDIVREEELLAGGLAEYRSTRRACAQAALKDAKQAAARKRAETAARSADENAEEQADETTLEALASNWEEIVYRSDPVKYRALLRELFGEAGGKGG